MGAVESCYMILLPLVTDTGVVEVAVWQTRGANVNTLGEACATSQCCEDVVTNRLGF